MAAQGGALAGQEAAINQNIANQYMQQAQGQNQAAQTAASIYGQQAQQLQGQAQGIGQLATQQYGIGQQQAQGLGALAGQLGQIGVQQGAIGQTAQALNQSDVNFLYNTGQAQQAFNQQTLDAQRSNELQQVYAPYQQAGFLSDIYKGAPSTQMSTAVASQPSASPFQQAVGIGLGAISTAAGVKKAGLFLRGRYEQKMMAMDDDIENIGIMQGFMDSMEDEGDEGATTRAEAMLERRPDTPEILMNNLRGDMRSIERAS
jgi:hypothetical protein